MKSWLSALAPFPPPPPPKKKKKKKIQDKKINATEEQNIILERVENIVGKR